MKRILFFVCFALVGLGGLFAYQWQKFHDGKLHLVFCDVGQGDAILITTPSKKHILVDAGPDKTVLNCLAKHLPFWERTIDIVFLTHPHADHFMGIYYVTERYSVVSIATENLINKTEGFTALIKLLHEKSIPKQIVTTGDSWKIGEMVITIAGPTDEFVVRKNPDRVITSSAESASLVMLVSYGDFSALLTGDAPLDEMQEIAQGGIAGLDILQIPHHGSSTGVDEPLLALLSPKLAVISVGAKNRYGHPTPKVLELLKEKGIGVLRTDQEGDIEITTDGKSWKAN